MKAFKATHAGGKPDYGDVTYEVGRTYTLGGKAKLCKHGYHASQRADDVLTYYPAFAEMYEVTIAGSTDIGDDKICGTIVTVNKQLTPQEIAEVLTDKNNVLRLAAANGHKEIVELLIPLSDPKAWESQALRWAALNGHKEIVELLIPISDPMVWSSAALYYAAWKGHKECVELLLPVSDPKAHRSQALRSAAYHGHKEIVELLVPVSDPAVLKELGLA